MRSTFTYLGVEVAVHFASQRPHRWVTELVRSAIPANVDERVEAQSDSRWRRSNNTRVKKIEEVADKIAHARGFGDLSENAEYTSAKQEQALLMKSSQALREKLRNSQIIDPAKLPRNGKVVFGTTVHLNNITNQEKRVLQIVGEEESDVNEGKISFSSPIAKAIIGKKEEDTVEVRTLEGIKTFVIKKIEYL